MRWSPIPHQFSLAFQKHFPGLVDPPVSWVLSRDMWAGPQLPEVFQFIFDRRWAGQLSKWQSGAGKGRMGAVQLIQITVLCFEECQIFAPNFIKITFGEEASASGNHAVPVRPLPWLWCLWSTAGSPNSNRSQFLRKMWRIGFLIRRRIYKIPFITSVRSDPSDWMDTKVSDKKKGDH